MKFTIICVFLYQIQFSNSISCFQCSLISSNAVHTCPSSNQDISKWKDSKDKLITHVKNSNSDSFSCIVGIDKTKKVYYQGGFSDCEKHVSPIAIQINSKSPAKSAEVKCCTKNGCNWNFTTASSDMSLSEIIAIDSAGTLAASIDWVPIVLIVLILITALICVCCLFFLRSKKRKEGEEDLRQPYTVSQREIMYAREKGQIAVTPSKRIDVAEAQAEPVLRYHKRDPARDHERYSAIDSKLYKKAQKRSEMNNEKKEFWLPSKDQQQGDSSGYSSGATSAYSGADPVTAYQKNRIGKRSKDVFDNDDFHTANKKVTSEELRMPRKGQDWVHIWNTATSAKPTVEKGSDVNAFRYNE